jgi:hypothetical protein
MWQRMGATGCKPPNRRLLKTIQERVLERLQLSIKPRLAPLKAARV